MINQKFSCLILSMILTLPGLLASQAPADAAQVLPSQFETLSRGDQEDLNQIRALYKQISDKWLILRLDPYVDADGIRKQLDQVAETLSALEPKPDQKKPDAQEIKQKLKQAYEALIDTQIRMLPTRTVEMRGALLDAAMLPPDAASMRSLVKRLKAAGFNALYPEVFRRGYALFKNPIIELDPALQAKQIDLLRLLTDAAQAEQMEVYPWFWIFRVLSPTIAKQNQITLRLPALMSKPLDGQAYQSNNSEIENESDSFISPASHEWRQLLSGLMAQTAQRYPINGYFLDYIRYGNRQVEDDLSMTRFQLDYYRKVGTFPPTRIQPTSDLQAEWHLWREEQVNNMVQSLRLDLAGTKKGLSLGGAVFRNEIQARITKMQNWRHWANNSWVDFTSPMMYTDNYRDLDIWMDWESDQNQRMDILYPILGAHKMRGDHLELLNQIYTLQNRQANGISIFAMRNLTQPLLDDLAQGPFRQPALIPHHDLVKAMSQQSNDLGDWLLNLAKRGVDTQSLSLPSRTPLVELGQKLQQLSKTFTQGGQRMSAEQPLNLVLAVKSAAEDQTRNLAPPLRARLFAYLADLEKSTRIYQQASIAKKRGFVASSRPPTEVIPAARPLPQTIIPEVQSAPVIDGRLDDEAWKNAVALPPLYWSTGAAKADTPTEIKLAYDQEALYISYLNDEPRIDRMHVSRQTSSALLEQDDTVQVFLNPGQAVQNYYYFVVNPVNLRYERASYDKSWSEPWQSASRAFSHGWITEIAIPFRSMGARPPDGKSTWKANFCRRRPQEISDFHCWSITFGGVHRLDRFGDLKFQPLPSK